MDFNKPLSRNEAILQNILGAQNVLIDYQNEIEAILQAILNDTPYTEEGRSRIARLLIAIKNNGTWDELPTLSRNEEILYCILNGEEYTKKPQSRIEELLIEWLHASPKGYEKTVIGNPIVISDALAEPVISLKAKLNPIQDLHGYDAPWVGGAGKNKFDSDTVLSAFTKNNNKYVGKPSYVAENYVISGGFKTNTRYTLSYKAYNNTSTPSNFRFVFSYTDGTEEIIGGFVDTTTEKVIVGTSAENKTISKIKKGYGNGVELTLYDIQLEEGSTATSFAPYSNICPISGWDEVEVGLYKAYQICEADNFTETTSNGLTMTYLGKGKFRIYGTMTNNVETTLRANIKEFVIYGGDDSYINLHNSKSGYYTLIFRNSSTNVDPWGFSTVNRTSSYIGMRNKTTNNIVMVVPASLYGTDIDLTFAPEIYSNNTKYTYPVTFTDGTNPLTVYGGYVDLVNGVMTVDRISVTVDENSNIISESGGLPFRIDLLTGAKPSSSASALTGVKCNFLKEVTQSSSWGVNGTFSRVTTDAKTVYFKVNSEITTIQQLKTFLQSNNLQFVYELATPLTIQLTPNEVQLLLGDNTIWSDTDDLELTYNGSNPALQLSTMLKKNSNNKQ